MRERTEISAVCFDFDGTLGMTGEELKNALKHTIEHLDLDCPDFDNVYRIGPSLQDMSAKLFPEKTAEALSEIQRVFRGFYDNSDMKKSPPYPWCEEILREFLKRGKKLYIVTNKRIKPLQTILRNFGFGEFFSGIFSPDICPHCEVLTKTELLQMAITIANRPAGNVLMVGDTDVDINAAHAVKCRSCGVLWGYGDINSLKKSSPDILVGEIDFFSEFDKKFI